MTKKTAETQTTKAVTPPTPAKRAKKLSKAVDYDNAVIKIKVLDGEKEEMSFAFTDLPEAIQAKFGPFGLSHKLGDAAAGKTGTEAEDSINKVFEGLKNGDWSTRAPAKPKVSVNKIVENYQNLDPVQKKAAEGLLKSLGIEIPV